MLYDNNQMRLLQDHSGGMYENKLQKFVPLRVKGTAVPRLERLNSQAKNKGYIRGAFFGCFEPAPGCGTVLWNECFIFILVRLINDAHEA
jgi:hypothetical protein